MNVQDLKAELDKRFCSIVGPPMAYWEVEPMQGGEPCLRFVYSVYAIGVESSREDTADHEDLLCRAFLCYFDRAQTPEDRADRVGTLIWRRFPRYDADEVDQRVRHRLSIRVYCPRLHRVMPAKLEGCETALWLEYPV
jgi:hypothetical protein